MPCVPDLEKAGASDPAPSTSDVFGLTEQEFARELHYLELDQAMADSRAAILPYTLLLPAFFTLLLPFASLTQSIWWAGAFSSYIAASWFVNMLYAKGSEQHRKHRLAEWRMGMMASSFIFGVLVSMPLWIAFPVSPVEIKLLWTSMIMMVVAAAPRLVTMRQAFALVAAAGAVSSSAWWVWGGDLGLPIAAMLCFLCCLLVVLAKHRHRGRREKFELHLRNEYLARELARRNAGLEQTNQAMTLLLAAASHDLRQPVHALGLLMEVIQCTPDPKVAQQRLAMATDCVESLSEMLNKLLDFTRMDSGHYLVHQRATPLQERFDDTMRTLGANARRKGLRMRVTQTALWVHTDPHLLHRMVFNLVSNAIKYTEQGGVHLYIEQTQKCVILHVEDTGVGIAPERLEYIFSDYVTSDEPSARFDTGIGLGLGIVRRCALLLDLRLTVRSQLGKGSCFSIHLGPSVQPDKDAPSDAPQARRLSGVVAVLENDPAILEGLSEILVEWGFLPVAGSTPDVVQDLLNTLELQPQVILSDLHLGLSITGFEAIESLRRSSGLAHVPAVVLTGDLSPDHVQRAQAHDIQLEHKPMRPARLRALLEGITGNA